MSIGSRRRGQTIRRFAIVLAAAGLALSHLRAAAPALAPERDPSLFPPAFFPGIDKVPSSDLILEGLATRYPHRILAHKPSETLPAEKAPFVTQIEAGIAYIRVYHLASALPAIEKNLGQAGLILDLRFLHTDVESSLHLAGLLASHRPVALTVAGHYPAGTNPQLTVPPAGKRAPQLALVILTNDQTAGPVEAVLDALQADEDAIGVGTATAGDTASFRALPDSSYEVMDGEIRRADGPSLVDTGFVPAISLSVPEEADSAAYHALTDAASITALVAPVINKKRYDEASLLRDYHNPELTGDTGDTNGDNDAGGDDSSAVDTAPSTTPLPVDFTLQKGVSIMEALVALNKIHAP